MDSMVVFLLLIAVMAISFLLNIPLGIWRSTVKKFSIKWFLAIHLAVPLIYYFRVSRGLASWTIPILIMLAILGQVVGGLLGKKLINPELSTEYFD